MGPLKTVKIDFLSSKDYRNYNIVNEMSISAVSLYGNI